MLRRPRFQPHLRVDVVPGEGLFLLSEQTQTVLQGRLYELVAPCLDGRTTEEVCERLRGQVSAAQVFYTLFQLEQKGYLSDGDAPLPLPEAALWALQQIDPIGAARRLAETPVTVRSAGAIDAGPFRDLLQALHVRLDGEPALSVVVTDSYLRSELRVCNEEALRDRRPWLLVKPTGAQVWIGPLFLPGKTGCWECLAERLRANSPVAGYLEEVLGHTGAVGADRCYMPATLQVGYGLAATAVASWVVRGEGHFLEGKVQSLDVLTGQSRTHTLLRQLSCPACGTPPPAADSVPPLVLQSCRKTYTEDGGHRALAPQQTLERYGHHVSPITGAVPLLEREGPASAAGNGVLHVWVSGHNAARRPRSLAALRSDLRGCNCGKGTSEVQARASALCEGLERHSGCFRGDEPRRRARLADLGDAALPPSACLLFSDKQYREREQWNTHGSIFNEVPAPFDPEAEIDWTPVWSLTRGAVRYLPTAFCYFNYPQKYDHAFCWGDSNGNAAGNTREEAILQGFLELVERDSVALWWYNRVRRPVVDLDSFQEPYLDELRGFLSGHHRDLWALDLTSDLGVPVFVAASRSSGGEAEQILFGFGAHFDARIALLRAVTELCQMLGQVLYTPPGAAPGAGITDKDTAHWLRTATVANQPYLLPLNGPPRTADCFPRCRTDDLRDDVLACQALVERKGMELLVLDQTRPEIGLPVVKVIVPGLRHFWARLAPGRLYDVPVELGWLPQPLAEEDLNPIPMFL